MQKSVSTRGNILTKRPVLISLLFIAGLCAFYGLSLWQLWRYPDSDDAWAFLREPYFRHILAFSFYQAFLSAVLSIILGLLAAHALFYQQFWGKTVVLKLLSLTMVLPALVAIFGVLGIYGNSGWLSIIADVFAWNWQPHIYGLSGILLTHVFFNLPLACRLFLQALQAIPPEQHQLAAQLNLRGFHFYRFIEWAYLRQQLLPAFALIFMLCFTSFTIVLTMGGGPKYTTLEVAIYQAVTFDFELGKAALLAMVQFVICLLLFQISQFFTADIAVKQHQTTTWFARQSPLMRYWQRLIVGLTITFLSLPLLHVVISGLSFSVWQTALSNPQLWRALGYSLLIAPSAGGLCVLMSYLLLLGARQLHYHGRPRLSKQLIQWGMLVLAVPTLVLAVGLFLGLRQLQTTSAILFLIVVVCNALAAMPFALRLLTTPLLQNMAYYEKLCQSLNIHGWQRLKWIEWHTLKRPMRSAFALATALSLGDFTAIALFGNQNFTSLPRLLYQQLGHYRSQEAAVTALILLLFCMMIFWIIEKNSDDLSQPR